MPKFTFVFNSPLTKVPTLTYHKIRGNMNKNDLVNFIDKKSCFIEKSVVIGKNVTIYPNNQIYGNTIIGDNVTLYPNNCIFNCKIGDNCKVHSSYLEDSIIKQTVSIGPYARLRPNSEIGNNCKIGNFVEVKNSTIGTGTKASHLAYVGDCQIGQNCNIGCGVIFVNYDGKNKHKTVVKDGCFVGSNCNIIAPVTLEENTYVACGTTVTLDTNKNDFVIGRPYATVKPNKAVNYLKNKN